MSRFGLAHEKVIIFLVCVLTVIGAWSYTAIPASIFPAMHFSRVDLVATAGDLPPERVRVAVAQPLERAVSSIASVTRVTATSAQGSAELLAEFDPNSDVDVDVQRVYQAVATLQGDLPTGTSVTATVVNPNSEPVLSYAFTSPELSTTVVREMLEQNVVPSFYGINGLARMLVVGGAQREFTVRLKNASLAAAGLSAADVSKALADASNVTSPGFVSAYAQRNVLVVDAGLTDAAHLRAVAIPLSNGAGSIPLGAVADVSLGVSPATDMMSYDAQHAVAVNFFALPGADAVKLADAIEARMAALAPRLPGGIIAHRYWDQTTLIRDSQSSLRDAIALGAVLAILVILVFLRNLRMTLVAALIIPIAVAIVLFTIGRLGQTLNLMSVGGLAVAVGLIIDDAIVVIENVARHMHEQRTSDRRTVVAAAMRELIAPMTASTVTTVVVFVPLGLVSGVAGFFFRALAMTLSTALVVSLLLAIFVTPILAARFIRPADERGSDGGLVAALLTRYEPMLRWALHHRRSVYGCSALVLLVTVVLLARLPNNFLPALDEGQFEIAYQMPVGATLQASDAAATMMEAAILRDPAVASVGRFTGIDTNGFSPTPPRSGTLRVKLKPRAQRASYDTVSDRLRDRVASVVPAAALDFHQILEDMINDLSGAPAPIQVTFEGPDQRTLIALGTRMANAFGKVSGVTDVFSGVNYDDPVLRIAPDASRLAALGMSSSDLSDALSASSVGTVAAQIPTSTQLVPVRVIAPTDATADGALIATAHGPVPLDALARVERDGASSDVTEIDGVRAVVVTANVAGKSLSSVIAGIRKALTTVGLPPGYRYVLGGQYQAQQASFREFATVIAIAVVLVFCVMLATFGSFRLPLVILTAIPLALIGVALALFLTRTPFNVSSFMGLLLLVGLIVKNGILLIDVANHRRAEGAEVEDALVEAGRRRLRPIVMTTCAAIGGLLPLAFGLGSGAEMEKPLAIAVIGGLSTATAFTLIAIPVLYAGFIGRKSAA